MGRGKERKTRRGEKIRRGDEATGREEGNIGGREEQKRGLRRGEEIRKREARTGNKATRGRKYQERRGN